MQRLCSGVAGERETEFGYFACKKEALKLPASEVPGEVVDSVNCEFINK